MSAAMMVALLGCAACCLTMVVLSLVIVTIIRAKAD